MGYILGGGFLPGLTAAAFGHNGIVEAGSEAFWVLIKLIIAVNLDGFLGCVADHVAVVAPSQMFFKLGFGARVNYAVQIIG